MMTLLYIFILVVVAIGMYKIGKIDGETVGWRRARDLSASATNAKENLKTAPKPEAKTTEKTSATPKTPAKKTAKKAAKKTTKKKK